MRIVLDLSGWPHVKRLKEWASVSRTLNQSKQLIETLDGMVSGESTDDDGEALMEQCGYTVGELDAIEPMLNSLHQAVRNLIWKSEAAENEFDSAGVALAGSSDLMLAHMMQRYFDLPGPERSKETPVVNKVISEIMVRVEKAQKKQGYI